MNRYSDLFSYKKILQILGKRPMCRLAIGFLLIICLLCTERSYQDILYSKDLGEVVLEGTVINKQYKEAVYGGYWQVTLKKVKVLQENNVEELFSEISNTEKIESLEGKYLCQITSAGTLDIKLGQRLLLKGKYSSWEEPTNPGQFHSGKYYCSQGILGQFKKCKIEKKGTTFSEFRENMWQIRQKAHAFLKHELGEEDGALISAMCLGEKSSLDEKDKNLYQRNGISHILAISGLHLMLLGMGIFQIIKRIMGNNRFTRIISIVLMSLYCIFTGNSISTIRATIMFALSLIAPALGRSYDSLSALGLAAILQLFMNPYILNHSGFLLSFLAVTGVTFLAPRLQELLGVKRKIGKSLCGSISSSLATLPVLLCNYGTYPWYSVFLNLLVIPVMSVLLFLAVMLVVLGMPEWIGGNEIVGRIFEGLYVIKTSLVVGIKLLLKYFEVCCNIFEHVPFQDGYIGAPNTMQIFIYSCLVLTALSGIMNHSVLVRKMILLLSVSILTLQFNIGAEITMLDVGQGDGIVIRNDDGNVYISDCGSSSVSKVGKYRLIPFLKYKGYGKIKGIFLSHLDQDHVNGVVELLEMAPEERIEISYLFLPKSLLERKEDREIAKELLLLAGQNKTKVVWLKQGDKIMDEKMVFHCLYPEGNAVNKDVEKLEGNMADDRNNQSMVLLMQYKDFDMLLTGDVEKAGEEEILEYIGRMEIEVLKTAHHGSSGSSSEEFLKKINPRVSLISCGKNNSYGHPHEETLKRMKAVGSQVMTTMNSGAITIRVRGKSVFIDSYVK